MANQFIFNIVVVGDLGVGKSCVVRQFLNQTFRTAHISTVGMNFFAKIISVQGKEAKLGIWDSSGREVRSIWSSYYRNAVGILLVYDITCYKSFENIIKWYNDVATHANASTVFLLVGNKSDLTMKREVVKETAENFAKSHGFMFMETSALLNLNIEEAFQELANEIYSRNLGVIYVLSNQSLTENNESIIKNLKEKRKRPITNKQCCGGCIWKWKWLLGYGCGLGRR